MLGININEEEAANLISVSDYDLAKAASSLDKNLYYLREFLLGWLSPSLSLSDRPLEKRRKRKR